MVTGTLFLIAGLACQCGPTTQDSPDTHDSDAGTDSDPDSQPPGDSSPDSHADTAPPPAHDDLNGDGRPDLILAAYRETFESADLLTSTYIFLGTDDGFEQSPSQVLDGMGTRKVLVQDLDRDGHEDLVLVNNRRNDDDYDVSTWVYWGQNGVFDSGRRSSLPCPGGSDGAIADLDGDGFSDLILACLKGGHSYVYWGGEQRYSTERRLTLDIAFGRAVEADDLNGDGLIDLVFASERDAEGNYQTASTVLLGTATGLATDDPILLPTVGAYDVLACDPDHDGFTDLLFTNHHDGDDYTVDSYLYQGSAQGWSSDRRTALATTGATTAAVADLDGDSLDDIVFANWYDGERYDVDSLVYWNSAEGFGPGGSTGLPTLGAQVARVADLNLDGFPDVILPSFCTDGAFPPEGRIFWGSADGPSAEHMTMVEPGGIRGMTVTDANLDGWPDLVFGGYNSSCHVSAEESYAYWGGPDGYGTRQVFETPVVYADPVVVGGGAVGRPR